ncbi:MAG: hypothetical protein J6T24_06585 [Clostridia bacterium]|nr:hypothetical protein [Clostridia bacterium]
MPVSFSVRLAPSAHLYAEGFSLSIAEAEADLAALLTSGAIPLTLSCGDRVLSQGLGIEIDTDCGALLYLYALTTDRAARGQGLLRTLLEEIRTTAAEMGFSALCLLPASDALDKAYRRMGFTVEIPAGGGPTVTAPTDLALYLDEGARPIREDEGEALYEALGQHMTKGMFDYTLSTLAPAVIPMRTEGGYALVHAHDPHYALATLCPAKRVGKSTLLAMPLGGRMPVSIPEPLPR